MYLFLVFIILILMIFVAVVAGSFAMIFEGAVFHKYIPAAFIYNRSKVLQITLLLYPLISIYTLNLLHYYRVAAHWLYAFIIVHILACSFIVARSWLCRRQSTLHIITGIINLLAATWYLLILLD